MSRLIFQRRHETRTAYIIRKNWRLWAGEIMAGMVSGAIIAAAIYYSL